MISPVDDVPTSVPLTRLPIFCSESCHDHVRILVGAAFAVTVAIDTREHYSAVCAPGCRLHLLTPIPAAVGDAYAPGIGSGTGIRAQVYDIDQLAVIVRY